MCVLRAGVLLQVLSEQKLELLRLECRDDLEIPFRERIQQVYSELEATRAECTRLKYENAFVKSELEHSQGAAQAVEHEMELRHDAEVIKRHKYLSVYVFLEKLSFCVR